MWVRNLLRSATFGAAIIGMAAGLVAGLVGGVAWAVTAPHVISQASRTFRPDQITIKRGEIVQIVNDDGDRLHHVYVESDQLKFDSGDQEPGSRTNIAFPVAGDFAVLCAIHPKMKLTVRVR